MSEQDPDRYPVNSRASVWSVTINTNQFAYDNNLDIYRQRLLNTFRTVFQDRELYDDLTEDVQFIAILTNADYERRPRMHVHGSVTVVHYGKIRMDYDRARRRIIEEMNIGNIYVSIKLSNSPLQFALYARKQQRDQENLLKLQEDQRTFLTTRTTRSGRRRQ